MYVEILFVYRYILGNFYDMENLARSLFKRGEKNHVIFFCLVPRIAANLQMLTNAADNNHPNATTFSAMDYCVF